MTLKPPPPIRMLVRTFCEQCGVHIRTRLLMDGRWRSETTLAHCRDHRGARHCLFCCPIWRVEIVTE